MLRLHIFVIALALSASSLAQPTINQRLVVVVFSSGKSQKPPNKEVAFFPSEVVTVLASKEEFVLVRGDDDDRPAWLPRANLADASSFRLVAAWNGEKKFDVSSADGDSGETYYFKPDGTFQAEHSAEETKKWSGQLYQIGQIFWAKPKQDSVDFEYWSVFRSMPSGKLCMLNFDTPLGCECVGTYGSEITTASCK